MMHKVIYVVTNGVEDMIYGVYDNIDLARAAFDQEQKDNRTITAYPMNVRTMGKIVRDEDGEW